MIFKKKNLKFDIPDNKSANVTREHSLRDSIFTRTRIVALCLILVLALSIAGTLAYLTWSGNQTPNRPTIGDVNVKIVETTTVGSATTSNKEFHDSSDENQSVNTADDGNGNKNAWLKATNSAGTNVVSEVVRMTISPEIEYLASDKTTVLGNAFVEEDWSGPQKDSNNNWYLKSNLLKIYLDSSWQSYYIYKDGTFIYNKTIKQGDSTEKLVTGAEWADATISRSDYGEIKVNIVAEAIQASEPEATAEWGLEVSDDGAVSVKAS